MKSDVQQAISDIQLLIMALHCSNRDRMNRLIRDRRRKRMEYLKAKQEMDAANISTPTESETTMDVVESDSTAEQKRIDKM